MAYWQYKEPREHFATLYNVSQRTVSRWAKAGFPLADEQATRALVAGQRTDGGKGASGSANAPQTLPNGSTGALGLPANIQRLQQAEVAAHADYLAALTTDQPALAVARRKDWLEFSEALRRLEVSAPDVAEQNKKLIRADEVSSTLSELFVTLRQDLENLGKRVAAELVGKDEIAIRQAIDRETGVLIESLYACRYLEAEDEQS